MKEIYEIQRHSYDNDDVRKIPKNGIIIGNFTIAIIFCLCIFTLSKIKLPITSNMEALIKYDINSDRIICITNSASLITNYRNVTKVDLYLNNYDFNFNNSISFNVDSISSATNNFKNLTLYLDTDDTNSFILNSVKNNKASQALVVVELYKVNALTYFIKSLN